MKIGRKITRLLFISLVLAGLLPFNIHASEFQPAVTATEITAFQLYRGGNPTAKVREAIKEVRVNASKSFVTELVEGLMAYDDAAYSIAIRRLKRSRDILESSTGYSKSPRDGDLVQWHALNLYWLACAYGAMDRRTEQLEVLDAYDVLGYSDYKDLNNIPRSTFKMRIVALVKLDRIEEARTKVEQEQTATDSPRIHRKLRALAILIQRFSGTEDNSIYSAYTKLIQDYQVAREDAPGSLVGGQALYAIRTGHYDEAKRLWKQGLARNAPKSSFHPLRNLVRLHTAAGSWKEAKESLSSCWNWQSAKYSYIRQELDKETRLRLAEFYLASGYPEKAWKTVSAVPLDLLNNPLRSGFRFSFSEQWEAGLVLVACQSLAQMNRQERELRSGRFWFNWNPAVYIAMLKNSIVRARLERRFRNLIVSQLEQELPLRNACALVDTPYWLWGAAINLLGPEVSGKLFDRYPLRGAQAELFSDALRADIAYSARRWQAVVEYCDAAMDAIPSEEQLLRARMLALRGVALQHTGREKDGVYVLAQAYRIQPSVFRSLGIRIPLNRAETELPSTLASSPSLDVRAGTGFAITMSETGNGWQYRLIAPDGTELQCHALISDSSLDEKDYKNWLISEFHKILLCSGSELTSREMNQIEGRAMRGKL